VLHPINLDGGNGQSTKRGEKDTAESIPDGHAIPALQRFHDEFPRRVFGLFHLNTVRHVKPVVFHTIDQQFLSNNGS
jgi:hypothetical protein